MTSEAWNNLFSVFLLTFIVGIVLIGKIAANGFEFLGKVAENTVKSSSSKGCGTRKKPFRSKEGFQAGTTTSSGSVSTAATSVEVPTINTAETKCDAGWELCDGVAIPDGYTVEVSAVRIPKEPMMMDTGRISNNAFNMMESKINSIGTIVVSSANITGSAGSTLTQAVSSTQNLPTAISQVNGSISTSLQRLNEAAAAVGESVSPDDIYYGKGGARYMRLRRVLKGANGQPITSYTAAPEAVKGVLCCYDNNPYIGARKVDFDNEPLPIPAVRNPMKSPTDLDVFYEDYDYNEYMESEKELAALNQQYPSIRIQDPPLFDANAMLQNLDADIDEIPWDFDNKGMKQFDTVWGIISPLASKSIFNRAYSELVLSNLANMKINDKGKVFYKSLFTGQTTEVRDQQLKKQLEILETTAMAIAPLAANVINDKIYNAVEGVLRKGVDYREAMKGKSFAEKAKSARSVIKGGFKKATSKVGMAAKKFLSATGLKRLATAVAKRMGPFFARLMRSFIVKFIIRAVAMLSSATATAVAANAAAVASFGALSWLAAIANTVLVAVSTFVAKTQIFMMFVMIILPPILEKFLDEGGTCPPNSKSLKSLIPQIAVTLISIFVPFFGDILDLFYPYLCTDDKAKLRFKIRLQGQPYYDDSTMSSFMHPNRDPMGADEDPDGEQGPKTADGVGYLPPPLREVNYDWCNFAHPVMLDRMAQFYYSNALLHPFEDDDGNTCIQYIVEFYGVVASSELSCDVACKMKTICYQPFTGQNYRESYFCDPIDPDYSLPEQVCYRRFYFVKGDDDPQGLFTVTACTNQNYTAPRAETTSFDGGEYVPSLPKQFKISLKDPMADQGALWSSIGANIAVGAGAMAIGMGAGRAAARLKLNKPLLPRFKSNGKPGSGGIFGRQSLPPGVTAPPVSKGRGLAALSVTLGGAVGGALMPLALQNTITEFEQKLGVIPPDDQDDSFLTGNPRQGYTLVTNSSYYYIERGPAIENAPGYKPFVKFCDVGAAAEPIDPLNPSLGIQRDPNIPLEQCKNYLTIRDTVNAYQAQTNKHVRTITAIEPRRGGTCYYKWREVDYYPTTNIEGTVETEKEVLMEYEIKNKASCIYEPKGLVFPREQVTNEVTATLEAEAKINLATSITAAAAAAAPASAATAQNKMSSRIGRMNDRFKKIKSKMESVKSGLTDAPFVAPLPVPSFATYADAARAAESAILDAARAMQGAIAAQKAREAASGTWSFKTGDALNDSKYGVISIKNPLPPDQREAMPPDSPMRGNIIWPTRKVRLEASSAPASAAVPSYLGEPKFPYKPFDIPRALPESTMLGGTECPDSVCENRDQMDRLMQDFNNANRSKGRQIIKILRAWTPATNRCDYDVEMMRTYKVDPTTKQPSETGKETKVVQRETIRIGVVEDPAEKCLFRRENDGSDTINSGTFIQYNTPDLSGADVSGGVPFYDAFVKGLKRTYNAMVAPLAQERVLDKSIDSSKRTYETSNKVLETVYVNQTLVGCPEKKCSDPDMLEMMAAHYNEKNGLVPGIYGETTERTAVSVLKAGIASGTQCDVMFKVRENMYIDILSSPDIDSQSTQAKAFRFNVAYKDRGGPGGTCRFELKPDSRGTVYTDVSSTAIGLRLDSSTMIPEYEIPIKKINCAAPATLNAMKAAIENYLNNRDKGIFKVHNITSVTKTFQPEALKCHYEIRKSMVNTNRRNPFKCSTDGASFTKCDNYVTYVNTEFTPSVTRPGSFDIQKATEYDYMMDTTYDINNNMFINGEAIYIAPDPDRNATGVEKIPLATSFDADKKQARVDKRIYTLPAK